MSSYFEPLEDRVLFAKLVFQGTAYSDTVGLDVKNGRLWYTLNGVTQKLNAANVGVVQVFLLNGNDKLIVGANAPQVYADGGLRDDKIFAGSAIKSVTILGGNGNDSIVTGAGNDSIDGGYGNDTVTPNGGVDTVLGGFGRDTIFAIDEAADHLDGGGDFDTAHLDSPDVFLHVENRLYE